MKNMTIVTNMTTMTIMTIINIRCLIIPAVLNGIWAFINFTKVPSTPEEFGYALHFILNSLATLFFCFAIFYDFVYFIVTIALIVFHQYRLDFFVEYCYYVLIFLTSALYNRIQYQSTQHYITLSNITLHHTTPHRTTQRRIETENSRAAAEKASRGIAEDAKAPIGFIEVRNRSKSRKTSEIRD